jgi:hypothetical protein
LHRPRHGRLVIENRRHGIPAGQLRPHERYHSAVLPSARHVSPSARLARGAIPLIGAAAATYWSIVRPWHLRWGATEAELSRRWPGDELVPRPRIRAVRAVTIAALPDRIWPWIMQVGRDRGGFYSYTWLENLIGADIHNISRLMSGLPERQPGDTVWMGPEERFGGQARMIVAKVVRERALGEGRANEGVWSFILDPLDRDRTRLIMLSLGAEAASPFRRVADLVFWEPAHFIMERRMMLTIKRLAENTPARD